MDCETLRTLLHYDPEAGDFTWLVKPSQCVSAGAKAGTKYSGYLRICYKKKMYLAHRLAWLYMTGEPAPETMDMDHVDGNPLNNSWSNIRLATRSQNSRNRKSVPGATSIWKGVHWNSARQKWMVQLKDNGITHYLGLFEDEREAAEEYIFKALEIHGEYTRFA